ncbi:hypothetical protein LTR78_010011 [Recurvomyces mirabilis]|uniref:Uncharacterized protein n=1 Tax=Recurvomyces mirabilis TaxID=574656 RepID=A0AAE0WF71_9PEZI|nr:hypothetical protein LTR78_010011 [Recurvomyces mirabilis]KAK5149792.1 hypothetical protein LTS14_010613 [Recurvomyces mirabilis]
MLRSLECTYIDKQERAFVDQNKYSADLSRRRASRTARTTVKLQLGLLTPVPDDSHDSLVSTAVQGKCNNFSTPTISASVVWELKDRVLARFLGRWTSGLTCLGRQDAIIRVHNQAKQTSPIGCAILAIAFADLAVNESHGDAATQSCMAYHETLQQVKNQIAGPLLFSVAGDEFLTAILAIDAYEILYIRRPAPLGAHTSAIVELLRLRDLQAPDCTHESAFERIAAPRILARQLLCGLPSMTRKGRHETMLGTTVLDRRVAKLVNESCDLLYMLKGGLYDSAVARASDEGQAMAMRRLCSVLVDTQRWLDSDKHVSRLWRVEGHGLEDQASPLVSARPSILVSGQIWVIRDWILYHMSRIKIFEAIIDKSRTGWSDVASRHFSNTQTCLEEICSGCNFLLDTMPFLIGSVDVHGAATGLPLNDTGLLIAHYPLWLIEGCKYASPDSLHSAKALLGYIQAQRSLRLESNPA